MLKLVISAAGVCIAVCAAAVQVQASDLSGQEISALLAEGATVELDTPIGTKLPLRYGSDGKLAGEAGGLAWYLGAATDRGKWWVEDGQLCHQWRRWFDAGTQCLKLRRQGRMVHWRSKDGQAGTATITVAAAKPAPPLLASATPPSRAKSAPPPEAAPAPPKLTAKIPELPPAPKLAGAGRMPGQPADEAATQTAPDQAVAAERSAKADAPPPATPEFPTPDKVGATDGETEPRGQTKRATLPVYKVANVRSDDVLNVRSGPSSDFDIVGVLPPGTGGIAITSACHSQWCPVRHESASGWVNRTYLMPESAAGAGPEDGALREPPPGGVAFRDSRDAPRSCLTPAVRTLLDRIEQEFGRVQVISTCRPGATIRGTWRPSRHASGNAVDFKAGPRKAEIVAWLIAHHRRGGIMTYADMDHIHIDIGPYFVSVAGGPRWASWRGGGRVYGAR
jgi:hypothetical protein